MQAVVKSAWWGALFSVAVFVAESPAAQPWASGALNVESGILWEVGSSTNIPYRLVPTQLSWRSGKVFGYAFSDGSQLVVRHRLTMLADWVQHGPESHYAGFSFSPSVEWWNAAGTWSLFTGSGGGFGWIDSREIKGGMGQDLTLNWFIRGGIEHVSANHQRWSAGIMFQHMSNGGMTRPNPGMDALGFTVGYSWAF